MPISFDRNVSCESFGRNVLGSFFLEPHFASGAGCWWRGWAGLWAGLGLGLGLGLGGAGAGAALKLKLVYSKMATLCPDRKYELSNGQRQQAISIFLKGFGFRALGFEGLGFIRV